MSEDILVTGGAGFIGSNLVGQLLASGHRVAVLDNFNNFYNPDIKRENISLFYDYDNFKLIEGDIRNSETISGCFRKFGFQEIIHLAAMAGVRPSIKDPVLYQEVNLIGTMNLLEACRQFNVRKFIFASSSSVYGNSNKVPFSETDSVDHPISPYASTKRSGELMVYTYHYLYNIKAVCLRFFTVYGPGQRPEMAIHLFTDRIYRGELIYMFGDGESQRDYTYIEDIISGITGCREKDFDYEIFNLGRSDAVKLKDLISKIEIYLGKKARVILRPDQPGDIRRTFADISKAARMTGYSPKVSIDDGLQRFVKWYKNRGGNK